MKQYYAEYTLWEDYINGMYDNTIINEGKTLLGFSLLSNDVEFYNTMSYLINDWEICTKVNLTNTSINRRAWLGRAACNFKHGLTELETRVSWSLLSEQQKNKANKLADKIIKIYEKQNRAIHKNMGTQMLLQWHP